jgi:hypothetical protein
MTACTVDILDGLANENADAKFDPKSSFFSPLVLTGGPSVAVVVVVVVVLTHVPHLTGHIFW